MITIRIPALWRGAAGAAQVDVEAADVRAALTTLAVRCPRLARLMFDDTGQPQTSIQIFVNREAIRYHGNLSATLNDGDEIYIVPMLSGG